MGKHKAHQGLRERKHQQPRYWNKLPVVAPVPAPAVTLAKAAEPAVPPPRRTKPAARVWNPALLADVQRHLGYTFTDPQLLQLSLTHSSLGSPHNERLEYLGDAVLGVVVGSWLYQHYPHWAPGQLTEIRSALVNTAALAAYARQWELPYALHCSLSADAHGIRRNTQIAANTLEALIGALWIDSGYRWQTVLAVLQDILQQRLNR